MSLQENTNPTMASSDTQTDRDVESTRESKEVSQNDLISSVQPSYDNPREWSTIRKIRVTFLVCSMAFALSYSSSAYTSSTVHLIEHFKVSEEVITLGLSLFVLGFALGPLFFGPASQVFGHKLVFNFTFILFTGFSFGFSEAKNIETLLICRFFAGLFGSSAFTNTPAAIGDLILPKTAFRYMIWFGLSVFAGPSFGPLIGAFIDNRIGFRWNLRIQAIFIGFLTLLCLCFLPETNHLILQERANKNLISKEVSFSNKIKQILSKFKVYALQSFVVLLTEPIVLLASLYLSLLYAILYLSFQVVPIAFIGIRHFTEEQDGLVFISSLIGSILGGIIMVYYQEKIFKEEFKRLKPGQKPSPELRLKPAILSSIFAPIGLFIFAWTAPFIKVHWIVPCIGLAIAFFGIFCVFTSFIPYLVEYGGIRAPIVMAAQTALRCTVGAAFPLFGRQMYDKLTVQGGTSLLAGLTILMTPMAAAFYVYGEKLRSLKKG